MRKFLIAAPLVLMLFVGACGGSAYRAKVKPKCDRACQRLNDRYFKPDQYVDYFVNDSDGGKDLVFTVYKNVKVGDFTCAVIKSDNYSISAVCPGAVVTQGYAPPDKK